jgi:hypothetical protein
MAKSSLTIRLEESTRRRLASVARRRGRSPSSLVRAALEGWLAAEAGPSKHGLSPYEMATDLIGCVEGGDAGRSTRGSRAIAAALRARRARGR